MKKIVLDEETRQMLETLTRCRTNVVNLTKSEDVTQI